ncbi:Nif11-like leader peptide family natural product precursor [Fusibacter sp. 3D3]|uniref:Nif11-like leader peptide family natural product precursor n=1 Tax=Fusibacter sp. 3D3 TaxID=1048380 RepID=UPI0008534810|nr:Nif11-like leader peptide family natural product precursor [Fusibacter sp. 3D3]GAU78477.1 hypothetical protein F3D3_3111 [Fusibacter sp. 3D3]
MNANLTPSIQKMLKMAQENPAFKNGLSACTTKDAAMTYLKSNGIMVSSDELQSFATSQASRADVNNNVGTCYVHI